MSCGTRISLKIGAVLVTAVLGFGAAIAQIGLAASNSNVNDTIWRTLRIGGGGYITGLDISPDGATRVVRTDTYGAYIWDDSSAQWMQLVTANSMPATDIGVDKGAGVYEIRVAPGRPTRLYMEYSGYVYRSDDRGRRWNLTAFARVAMDANDSFRVLGQKMAVDPADPDVLYVGTAQNGLFVTSDGGRTWRAVAAIPKSASASDGKFPGITGMAFDPSCGASGGKTGCIFVSSYGNGVYRSSNAGVSWSRLDGGPSGIRNGKVAGDGAYYVVGDDGESVWRYFSGAWTDITPHGRAGKGTWSTVVTDPSDPARVVAAKPGGSISVSRDRGGTWSDIRELHRAAADVPWLAWTNESYMSVGDMMFDPVTPGRLWFAEGIGVWYADLPNTASPPASVTFNSQSAGIEQLVGNQVIAPPRGKPVVASWDRPVFYIDNPALFPATHGPDNQNSIVMGWALDYASTDPSFIVGLFDWWNLEKSAYSRNGGRTWSAFPSYPPTVANGKIGGSIAASTPRNIVWVPANDASPYYTNDGGVSWKPIVIAGVPTSDATGWGGAYYFNRHIVAADRITVGTFYMYNSSKGLYRSTDGGASWVLVHPGEIAPYSGFHAKLQSVPGHAGHLFFTSGPQGGAADHHPAANAFMRSIDGGATWTAVPNVLEVRAFGFGKAAIYIAGWVNGVYGIWRSEDNAQSWVKIGDYPLGIFANVTTIDGDKNVYGTVYLGFSGAGFAYGSLAR